MKHILLLALLGTWTLPSVYAQVSLTPTQVVVPAVSPDSAQVVGYGRVKNNADEARTYRWVRSIRSLTTDWETAVCDTNLCYLPFVDSMEFELSANLEANLNVYIYPNGKAGSAIIEVKVIDVNNPEFSANAVYYFNASPSKTDSKAAYRQLKVYPNPARSFFQITENEVTRRVVVFNLVGRQIQSYPYVPGDQYFIGQFPKGTYLVQLQDNNGRPLVTRLLNKL